MFFYLDGYNLIKVKKEKSLLNKSLKIFCNNKEINFETVIEENYIIYKLFYEYKDQDVLNVSVDKVSYEVIFRHIVSKRRFDEEYKVDVSKLGSFIEEDKTIFRLWSPLSKKAYVVLDGNDYLMNYEGSGLYSFSIEKNLDKHLYHYKVIREKEYCFNDPFSFIDNNDDSYVLNVDKFKHKTTILEKCNNPIIYEINVRDFSSDNNAPFKYPKKLLALSEEGLRLDGKKIGLDYLEELGVTHLQLMPIFSYDYDGGDYNWGYNPLAYNTIFKDYLLSEEPYEQIAEVQKTFDSIHRKNMRITLDVVFNHVYKTYRLSLSQMLPFYFFRYVNEEELAKGTYCGNEVRSEAYFTREYFKLLAKRYIEIYDIDGLRFDLMGILDCKTINEIKELCLELKDDFLLYGEGWNMGDVLNKEDRATKENADKLKGVYFFNDDFRNILRGRTIDDAAYLLGEIKLKDEFINVLNGTNLPYFQSINYLECHDNFTFYDKVSNVFSDEIIVKKICKLSLAIVVLTRGLPFIHSGQEFMRTKNRIDNTYNLGDDINHLDWLRKNRYLDVSFYLRELIKLKNMYSFNGDVVEFKEYYEVLLYKAGTITIFINPCIFDHIYSSDDYYKIVFDENGFKQECQKDFKIPAFSVVVAYKIDKKEM